MQQSEFTKSAYSEEYRNNARISIRKQNWPDPTLLSRIKPVYDESAFPYSSYWRRWDTSDSISFGSKLHNADSTEAGGAIARGKNVIVGDPKRLPPCFLLHNYQVDEDNIELKTLKVFSMIAWRTYPFLPNICWWQSPEEHESLQIRLQHWNITTINNDLPPPDNIESKVRMVAPTVTMIKGKSRQNGRSTSRSRRNSKKIKKWRIKRRVGVVGFQRRPTSIDKQKIYIRPLHLSPNWKHFALESEEPCSSG